MNGFHPFRDPQSRGGYGLGCFVKSGEVNPLTSEVLPVIISELGNVDNRCGPSHGGETGPYPSCEDCR